MKELVGGQVLLPAWESWASTVAFHDGDYHADYATHADRVLRLTDALGAELGLARGAPFAVLGVNGHEYLELYHAAFLGAGVINPLNLRLAGQELQFILADSSAEVIFVDQFFADHLDRAIHDVRADLALRTVVLIGDGDHPSDVRYEDLLASRAPRRARRARGDRSRRAHVHRRDTPARPRAPCWTSGPNCSTCTTSP